MGHKGRPPSTPSRIDGLSSPSYGELGGDEGSFVSSFTARTDNTKAARSGQGPEVGGKMTRFEDGSSSGGVSQQGDDASSKVISKNNLCR